MRCSSARWAPVTVEKQGRNEIKQTLRRVGQIVGGPPNVVFTRLPHNVRAQLGGRTGRRIWSDLEKAVNERRPKKKSAKDRGDCKNFFPRVLVWRTASTDRKAIKEQESCEGRNSRKSRGCPPSNLIQDSCSFYPRPCSAKLQEESKTCLRLKGWSPGAGANRREKRKSCERRKK